MSLIAIQPVSTADGKVAFRAVSADAHSEGATAGQALDALATNMGSREPGIILVQSFGGDAYFAAAKLERLQTLMDAWRSARDAGQELSAEDQAELQQLIDEEFEASAKRTNALHHAVER